MQAHAPVPKTLQPSSAVPRHLGSPRTERSTHGTPRRWSPPAHGWAGLRDCGAQQQRVCPHARVRSNNNRLLPRGGGAGGGAQRGVVVRTGHCITRGAEHWQTTLHPTGKPYTLHPTGKPYTPLANPTPYTPLAHPTPHGQNLHPTPHGQTLHPTPHGQSQQRTGVLHTMVPYYIPCLLQTSCLSSGLCPPAA